MKGTQEGLKKLISDLEKMVIPSINAHSFDEVVEKVKSVESHARWVHLDIEDGKFIARKTWNEPEDLRQIKTNMKLEAHLMISDPETYMNRWIDAGVERIIVHIEALKIPQKLFEIKREGKTEVALAINPDTEIERIEPYAMFLDMVLFMSVNPGPSGQKFIPKVLDKIKTLKERAPNVKIEIDGGINLETIALAKNAGVDYFVSGSYLFNKENPIEALKELEQNIV